MPIECRFLEAADAYERTVTAWVDRGEGSLLELHARLSDGQVDLEVGLVAEPSPSYQLSAAWATARSEATRRLSARPPTRSEASGPFASSPGSAGRSRGSSATTRSRTTCSTRLSRRPACPGR